MLSHCRGSRILYLGVIHYTCTRSWLGWLPHPCSISMLTSAARPFASSLFCVSARLYVIQNGSLLRFAQVFRIRLSGFARERFPYPSMINL